MLVWVESGAPKRDEGYVSRFGWKVSLRKKSYLAVARVNAVGYLADVQSIF